LPSPRPAAGTIYQDRFHPGAPSVDALKNLGRLSDYLSLARSTSGLPASSTNPLVRVNPIKKLMRVVFMEAPFKTHAY